MNSLFCLLIQTDEIKTLCILICCFQAWKNLTIAALTENLKTVS